MSNYSEGVVLRAAMFMGYTVSEARNFWKLGYPDDYRILIEDAVSMGFDLDYARQSDASFKAARISNRANAELNDMDFISSTNKGDDDDAKV